MTREEFSAILAECRKQKKVMLREMCYKIGCLGGEVYKIEKGKCSYRMDRCLKYLDAVNTSIQLTKRNTCIAIKSYQNIKDILLSDKYITESKRSTSLKLGMSRSALDSYCNKNTTMSIDVFLKLVDYLDFNLKIVSND